MSEMRIAFDSYAEVLPLSKLKKSKHQRNKHPKEQIERLAKIMKEHGVRHPIHISKLSGQVCFGHGRWEAAKLNGWKEFPVVYQQFNNDDEEYACVQSDNAIAHWAELDLSAINTDLANLGPDFDIDLLGIKDFVLEPAEKLEPQCDEDEVPDNADTRVKLGDVWRLGRHRLMCGDSTSITDVEKLMAGEKADMVFTDPPYGVSYTGGLQNKGAGLKGGARQMIKNDDIDLYEEAVKTASIFCVGPVFMFYADTVPFGLYRGIEKAGAEVVALIIWKKKGGYGALGASYKPNHEPCVIWKQKKHKLNFIGDTTENRVWEEAKDGINKLHPTQKPVSIPERAIKNHDAPKVLDLFGGSGSTLIACEKTNRRCFMMEIDTHYCDVILARWEKYTGQKAERIDEETLPKERKSAESGRKTKARDKSARV